MDLLKAELAKKKQKTSELLAKAGGEAGGRRFLRRGEATKLEREQREKQQAELIRAREARKRKRELKEQQLEEEEEKRRRQVSGQPLQEEVPDTKDAGKLEQGGDDSAQADAEVTESGEEVPEKEAKVRLRALGLSVTLFGETNAQRSARLLQAEEDKGHHHDDFNLKDGHNVNNEFLGNVSADLTGSHLDAATGRDEVPQAPGEADGDSDDDDDEDDEDDDEQEAGRQEDSAEKKPSADAGQGSGGKPDGGELGANGEGAEGGAAAGGGDEDRAAEGKEKAPKEMPTNKLVRTFFKGLLKDWEMDLNARPDHVKRTVQGKLETKTQKQAKDYMRPLFKLCKQKQLDEFILKKLVEIIHYLKDDDFVKANDVYIMTAIGNAPWPIGLTMVGIHERSGRERISSKNVAHIMNNEAQRKYLVSVKRLMTYLQDKRVDVSPSRKVR